jgi:hypothetical protein
MRAVLIKKIQFKKNISKIRCLWTQLNFIEGHYKKFVGDFFTDIITDRLRPSAYPSSVIPHSVAISVGKTKKPFADGFTNGICAPKKKIPA